MLLLDTSGLLAALDASQRLHRPCREALEADRGPLLLSRFVTAELDDLPATRVGASAQRAFLAEAARGAYRLETFGVSDVELAAEGIDRYESPRIGLADASLVVLAGRTGARDVLTLDVRYFSVLRTSRERAFRLRPEPEAGR